MRTQPFHFILLVATVATTTGTVLAAVKAFEGDVVPLLLAAIAWIGLGVLVTLEDK